MNNLADRIYMHAKIHALHGYLLSKDDYHEIVRTGKINASLPEISGKREISGSIQLKEVIFRHNIERFIRLIRLNAFYADFFKAFLLLFELSNIKYVLLRSYGRTQLFQQWNDVTPHNIIDAGIRTKEIGINELRELFGDTIFSEVMDFDEPPSYEELESKIDLLALKNLQRFSTRLFPADLKMYNSILIRKTVSLKILWDKRCEIRKESDFRQFNPLDIFDGTAVSRREIDTVEKEITRRIKAESDNTGSRDIVDDISQLELFLNRLFMSSVNKIFSKDFHSVCPVLSYAWSLYYQILNLFMIIDGFQLQVDPDAIMQHLVYGE